MGRRQELDVAPVDWSLALAALVGVMAVLLLPSAAPSAGGDIRP